MYFWQAVLRKAWVKIRFGSREKCTAPQAQKNTWCARFDTCSRGRPETTFCTKHNNQPLTIVQYAYWASVDAPSRAIKAAYLLFCCIFYHSLNSRFLKMRQRYADFCARKSRHRTRIRGWYLTRCLLTTLLYEEHPRVCAEYFVAAVATALATGPRDAIFSIKNRWIGTHVKCNVRRTTY